MPVYLLLSIPLLYLFEQIGFKKLCSVLLAFVFIIEFTPKNIHGLNVSQVPKVYKELKSMEGENLLPVPFGIKNGYMGNGDFKKKDMLYQTVHEKNLISGYGPFGDSVWNYYHSDTIMKTMLSVQRDTSLKKPDFSRNQKKQFFRHFKPDFIIITPEYRDSKLVAILNDVVKRRIESKKRINDHLLITLN